MRKMDGQPLYFCRKQALEPTALHNTYTELIFGLVMVASLAYAFIYRSNPTRFITLMRCANDRNLTDQLFRENNRVVHQTLSLLSGLGSIIIGTLMSWGTYRLNYVEEFTATTLFFGVLGALLLVMFRFTILSGIGTVLRKPQVIDHVLYIFWVILAFLGPVLLPIIALAIFGPISGQVVFIWVGLGVIVLGYIVFLTRSLMISFQEKGIGPLNLIYYFCALEIMPVLVAYRTLLN